MLKADVIRCSKSKTTGELRDCITKIFDKDNKYKRMNHLPYPIFPSMWDVRPYEYYEMKTEGDYYLIPVWHFCYLDLQVFNEYDTEITERDRKKYINEWKVIFEDEGPLEFKINYAGFYLHNYPHSTRILRIRKDRVLFAENKIDALDKLSKNHKFSDKAINAILNAKQINTPSNFKRFKHLLNGNIKKYKKCIPLFEDENIQTLDLKLNYLALGKYDL